MYEIRTITSDDADLFRSRLSRGFGDDVPTDEASAQRFEAIFEYDRTFAAFEGDDIIGTGAAFSLGLTVPGGAEVPMGGTTVISVQPTHRRRGVLRALMGRHLDEIASQGEPLAGLWASESSIYGRFGYGAATHRLDATIDSRALRFLDESTSGRMRLMETKDAEPVLRSLYEQVRPTRAGMLTRSDAWWEHRLMADPTDWRGGKTARRYLVFEEEGTPTGYATYRQKSKWEDFVADGQIDVSEMFTTTEAAHTAIWSFLSNVDLYPNVAWWNMPLDDPLPLKVTDRRRVARKLIDALWVRLMDVPAALVARGYESDGVVTIDVEDPSRPATSGTYRLEVAAGEVSCERVEGDADVELGIDVLGSLYLGGGDAHALAAAGRIGGEQGAVTSLHRLFRTDRAPWCPEVF